MRKLPHERNPITDPDAIALYRKIVEGNRHASRAYTVNEMTPYQWGLLQDMIAFDRVYISRFGGLRLLHPVGKVSEIIKDPMVADLLK